MQNAVHHSQAGPQDRYHGNFFAFDDLDIQLSGPSLNAFLFSGKIFGGFIGQQTCHLGGQISKIFCGNVVDPHQSEFVPHKRMLHNFYRQNSLLGFEEIA